MKTLKQEKSFRILSCDGGGTRSIISLVFLDKISQITGKHPTELFDLFVGSSAGAILVALINMRDNSERGYKYSTKDLKELYLSESSLLLESSYWRRFVTINGIYGNMYCTKKRDEKLKSWFNSSELKDSIKDIIIPSFSLTDGVPVLFKSRKAKCNEKDNYLVEDVIRASTALPTIFPPHKLVKTIGDKVEEFYCIDAIYAKNPVLFGISEVINKYERTTDNLLILSLGTGYSKADQFEGSRVISGVTFLTNVLQHQLII